MRYQIFDVNNYTRYDLSIYDATLIRGDGTTTMTTLHRLNACTNFAITNNDLRIKTDLTRNQIWPRSKYRINLRITI